MASVTASVCLSCRSTYTLQWQMLYTPLWSKLLTSWSLLVMSWSACPALSWTRPSASPWMLSRHLSAWPGRCILPIAHVLCLLMHCMQHDRLPNACQAPGHCDTCLRPWHISNQHFSACQHVMTANAMHCVNQACSNSLDVVMAFESKPRSQLQLMVVVHVMIVPSRHHFV